MADLLGLLSAVLVTAASADDGATAPRLLGQLHRHRFPQPETVWGDAKYRNTELDGWLKRTQARFRVAVVERPEGSVGFMRLPKRRVAEQTLAWRRRGRRPSKAYECRPKSSAAWVRTGTIGRMRRLAPDGDHPQAPSVYR